MNKQVSLLRVGTLLLFGLFTSARAHADGSSIVAQNVGTLNAGYAAAACGESIGGNAGAMSFAVNMAVNPTTGEIIAITNTPIPNTVMVTVVEDMCAGTVDVLIPNTVSNAGQQAVLQSVMQSEIWQTTAATCCAEETVAVTGATNGACSCTGSSACVGSGWSIAWTGLGAISWMLCNPTPLGSGDTPVTVPPPVLTTQAAQQTGQNFFGPQCSSAGCTYNGFWPFGYWSASDAQKQCCTNDCNSLYANSDASSSLSTIGTCYAACLNAVEAYCSQ
jgi:hypothetical protein